jgi:hypothetical protein
MQTAYFPWFLGMTDGAAPTGVVLRVLEILETPYFHRGKILHGVACQGSPLYQNPLPG